MKAWIAVVGTCAGLLAAPAATAEQPRGTDVVECRWAHHPAEFPLVGPPSISFRSGKAALPKHCSLARRVARRLHRTAARNAAAGRAGLEILPRTVRANGVFRCRHRGVQAEDSYGVESTCRRDTRGAPVVRVGFGS